MLTVSGIGRLGAAPKMSFTPNGTAQTTFSVAVNTGFGDKKKTVWVALICWGVIAELINNKLEKGNRVFFTAEVTEVRAYTKKSGEQGTSLDAKLTTIDFVDATGATESTPYDHDNEPEEF